MARCAEPILAGATTEVMIDVPIDAGACDVAAS